MVDIPTPESKLGLVIVWDSVHVYTSIWDSAIYSSIFYRNHGAHDAGILCLTVARDADGSTWYVGPSLPTPEQLLSFSVKVWGAAQELCILKILFNVRTYMHVVLLFICELDVWVWVYLHAPSLLYWCNTVCSDQAVSIKGEVILI